MRCSVLAVAVLTLTGASSCGRAPEAEAAAVEPARETPGPSRPEPSVPPAEPAAPAVGSPAPSGAPPEVEHPYDERANADEDIRAAVASARGDGKRVLVVFGGNWCPWCRRLEHTFRNEPRVRSALEGGFHVVHVDTGARHSGRNAAVNERYGNPMQHGLPVLVVLDATGAVVATQETGALERGDRHDPERVLAFLARVRSSSSGSGARSADDEGGG